MRKQYHFRPSDKGLLAWDVTRLIALSKDFPVIDIPLSEIRELDETFWFAEYDEKPTCRAVAQHAKRIQEVEMKFPIILFSDGGVADGMHRVCRAFMEGKISIKAVRFEMNPTPDYIGIAPKELPY